MTSPEETLVPAEAPEHAGASRLLAGYVLGALAVVLALGTVLAVNATTREPDYGIHAARIRFLQGAVKAQSDDAGLRLQLAFAYQQAGANSRALREYKRVLSEAPEDLSALYNSGFILLGQGGGREGEERLLRVLELSPVHSLAAKALGRHYAERGEYDELLTVVLPAAEAHPGLGDLQYLAGLGAEKTGRSDDAAARYAQALRLIPDMTEAQDGLDRLEAAE